MNTILHEYEAPGVVEWQHWIDRNFVPMEAQPPFPSIDNLNPGPPTQQPSAPTWTLIDAACPRCRAVSTCYRCGTAIACRFGEGGIRVHVGRTPAQTATYSIVGADNETPDFPGAIGEYTWYPPEGR